jgi:MarR family transcriptional regulator, organic hydroperoxide resistance regulator
MAALQKRKVAERPQRRRGTPARPPKTGLGMLLRDADTAFNRYLTAQLAAHGVTFGQFQHLRNLWVENGLTQAELSRRIGIEMASSTAILDSLVAAKLITRVRNTADRRKINVFLTPAGAALEKALMACAADSNRRASKGLTRREVAQLFALAGQIIANFRALRAAPISGKTRGGMARNVRPAAAPRGRVRRNMPRAAE